MTLKDAIMKNNPCYKERNITVKGLMLHSVGCAQPSAEVFIKKWNLASYDRACVHGFIDANTGTVYQTLPWNKRGWHCGASGNDTHIGVEMCESSYITYTSGTTFTVRNKTKAQADAKRAYKAAVELFAMLCAKYKLDPKKSGVIVSHKEGHALGIASNHGDPEHYWKGLGLTYTMNGFRTAVASQMKKDAKVQPTPEPTPAPQPAADEIETAKSHDDKIKGTYKIIAKAGLYLRKGAGSDKEPITVMYYDTTCTSYGNYTKGWYLVTHKKDGKTYTGFCAKDYLKKV